MATHSSPSGKISPALQALLDKVKQRASSTIPLSNEGVSQLSEAVVTHDSPLSILSNGNGNDDASSPTLNQYGISITYNTEQQQFIHLAESGESCVLIGAAGTGKTTCTKGAISALIHSGRIPVIHSTDQHKYLQSGTPGIICTSFTRRAVRNIRRAMSEEMKANCITIHKLLEYAPVQYEVYDEKEDKYKNTMRFEPTRNAMNTLPSTIKTIVFDESSMISVELYEQLLLALPHEVQFIFIGDIQQLPPVFGSAILGFKLLSLPVVELTQVYRQALESPIIALATDIRNGIPLAPFTESIIREHPTQGKLTLHPWKKKLHPDIALLTIAKFFTAAIDAEQYDPLEDQILIPFNKACGTIELNKHIAQHLARKQGRSIYEVIAGFNKYYFSVGDLVLFDKEDAQIVSITRNGLYLGKKPQKESPTLDYWGHDSAGTRQTQEDVDFDLESIDAFLEAAAASNPEEKVNTASHIIRVQMLDTGDEVDIESAAEVNSLLLSYALTVHKSQGSEFQKVFIVLHQSHNTMITRELLYTAVTRARQELYVICEPNHFDIGVTRQKIKGTTLADKAEYFKGKLSESQGELG